MSAETQVLWVVLDGTGSGFPIAVYDTEELAKLHALSQVPTEYLKDPVKYPDPTLYYEAIPYWKELPSEEYLFRQYEGLEKRFSDSDPEWFDDAFATWRTASRMTELHKVAKEAQAISSGQSRLEAQLRMVCHQRDEYAALLREARRDLRMPDLIARIEKSVDCSSVDPGDPLSPGTPE